MLTLVWTMCLLCKPEKVQVYVPECSILSGLLSRRDPSPCRSWSWSRTAWPSHRLTMCPVLLSYFKIRVCSAREETVHVREKFSILCGAMHEMDSGCPSSWVIFSEFKRKRVVIACYLYENVSLWLIYDKVYRMHLGSSEKLSTPGFCRLTWKSKNTCGRIDYPQFSACSPQWTGPCDLWS